MHRLIKEYRPLLIIFLVGLAAVGSIAVYYFLVRLVRPLHTIEEATKVVGQGDFRPIPHDHREDEIGQLIKAFNRMVLHLKQNNEQMVQTEKLTSLGTLTSGVAHELNNPLNNISTSCQILLEEMPPETEPYHTELLRAIDSQVEIARDIVGSLLEFSRRRQFKLERQNLKQVVSESLKLIRGETPVGVEAKVDIPGNLALYLDKGHIVQALINLFMNSFQAMEKGGILTISARELKESGQIRLTIQDTGKGIPPEVLPQVFDPFFTTKKVGKGTGLGLSITYGIIERHHGHIKAESEQDQGAKIIITLPLNPKEG
jgi:signal transduction histidine kinase